MKTKAGGSKRNETRRERKMKNRQQPHRISARSEFGKIESQQK